MKPFAYIDGLVQDCSISIADALEILQSYIKPSTYDLAFSHIKHLLFGMVNHVDQVSVLVS